MVSAQTLKTKMRNESTVSDSMLEGPRPGFEIPGVCGCEIQSPPATTSESWGLNNNVTCLNPPGTLSYSCAHLKSLHCHLAQGSIFSNPFRPQ